jgi:hypothetical protein
VLPETPVGGMKVPFRLGTPLGALSLAERGGAKYNFVPERWSDAGEKRLGH